MLVPLYGFLKGDTLGLVILVHDDDKIYEVGANLQEASAMRVAPCDAFNVYFEGCKLDPNLTVTQAGLAVLDRIDVIPEDRS